MYPVELITHKHEHVVRVGVADLELPRRVFEEGLRVRNELHEIFHVKLRRVLLLLCRQLLSSTKKKLKTRSPITTKAPLVVFQRGIIPLFHRFVQEAFHQIRLAFEFVEHHAEVVGVGVRQELLQDFELVFGETFGLRWRSGTFGVLAVS